MNKLVNNNYKTLIADECPIFRFGLSTLLRNVSSIRHVEEALDEIEVLKILKKESFDIVFLGIHIRKKNEIETINKISRIYPHIKIIALLISERYFYMNEILHCAAHGFLLKNSDLEEIKNALSDVCAGKKYFTSHVLNLITLNKSIKLKRSFLNEKNTLSIMYLMYHEKTSKEIAGILNLSCRTIEDYRMKILRSTNSVNMVGIIKYVAENGIDVDEFLNENFGRYCEKKNHLLIDYIR